MYEIILNVKKRFNKNREMSSLKNKIGRNHEKHYSNEKSYFLSRKAMRCWLLILYIVLTTIVVLTIHENDYPLVYFRNALGLIFVLFLPGYSLSNLFLKLQPCGYKESAEKRNNTSFLTFLIERLVLSIALSIVLNIVFSFLLSYLSFKITVGSITLTLFIFTLIFITIDFFLGLRSFESSKNEVLS